MRKALIGSLLLTAVSFGFVATATADVRVRAHTPAFSAWRPFRRRTTMDIFPIM